MAILAVVLMGANPPATAQSSPQTDRRIVVSLQDYRLWLIEGQDTLLNASVAVGRRENFIYNNVVYNWRTPRGERQVLGKRNNPVWTPPDWHYYQRATRERLELVKIAAGRRYPLADGSHLEIRGTNVVRVLGGQYWKVPVGREIIIDDVLYVPPFGTAQRRVPGVLGTRALDLGEGYLIHGTHPGNDDSIGFAASHGCIRMTNADVERLYDLVTTGTPVFIY